VMKTQGRGGWSRCVSLEDGDDDAGWAGEGYAVSELVRAVRGRRLGGGGQSCMLYDMNKRNSALVISEFEWEAMSREVGPCLPKSPGPRTNGRQQ
jgi:hypothetical protein